MDKQTSKPFVIGVIIFTVLIGFISIMAYRSITKIEDPIIGYSEAKIVNVVGTAAAPYRFSADAAASAYSTTTGTIYVGNDVNVLDLNIHAIEASSTMDVILMVEQSNDASCVDNGSSINWVDADPGTSTQESATTTHPFGLAAGHGGKLQITNWNGLCARVSVGSASSTIWISASKQSLDAN